MFPPIDLERTVVRQARSDGIKGVFVVPDSIQSRVLDGAAVSFSRHGRVERQGIKIFIGCMHLWTGTRFSWSISGDLTRGRATSERGVADGRHALRRRNLHRHVRSSAGGWRVGGRAAGLSLAMRLLRSLIDFRGRRVPFANDSLPVIMAAQKGSSSPVHQTDEEYMARDIAAFLPRSQNVQD